MFCSKTLPKPEKPVEEENDLEEGKEDVKGNHHGHLLDASIPPFTSGALLATSVFLVIPEAICLIQKHFPDSNEPQRFLEEHVTDDRHHHDDELQTGTINMKIWCFFDWRFYATNETRCDVSKMSRTF